MNETLKIKVKRLTETAKMPTKAHETDACFDLYCDMPDAHFGTFVEDGAKVKQVVEMGVRLNPHESAVLNTGITTEIPVGYFCPVFSRSGMGFKQGLRLANSVGVIDADYRGEWMVKLVNDSDKIQVVHHGDKIAQFTILPVYQCDLVEVDELSSTERGEGGFGSSGK